MSEQYKKYPIIGCCGINCGLCPRYYTEGSSRCRGCSGSNFSEYHPSCGIVTCCIKNKNLETCGECVNFPCSKFDEWFDDEAYDSFVTHKKCEWNLKYIKKHGIKKNLELLEKRMKLLEKMLNEFNDNRSKSFFCLASALLSLETLDEAIRFAEKKLKEQNISNKDNKTKAKILKEILHEKAESEGVELKLNKPPNWE